MTEEQRQAHNAHVRARLRRRAVADCVEDDEYRERLADRYAATRWWQTRRRRLIAREVLALRADRPRRCGWCGCEHRPSVSCPADFIPATLLGLSDAPRR